MDGDIPVGPFCRRFGYLTLRAYNVGCNGIQRFHLRAFITLTQHWFTFANIVLLYPCDFVEYTRLETSPDIVAKRLCCVLIVGRSHLTTTGAMVGYCVGVGGCSFGVCLVPGIAVVRRCSRWRLQCIHVSYDRRTKLECM